MVASRHRSKGLQRAIFAGSPGVRSLPASIAHQDLGALLAGQPEVSQRWRDHLMASPFGSVQVAGFNFPRPLGTSIPALDVRRISLSADPDERPDRRKGEISAYIHPLELPQIERSRKADRLPLVPVALLGASDLTAHLVPSETFVRPAGELALPLVELPQDAAETDVTKIEGRMVLASADPAALALGGPAADADSAAPTRIARWRARARSRARPSDR